MTPRIGITVLLATDFLRRGGASRALLVALCSVLVSGLLLVALAVVLFGMNAEEDTGQVSNLVADHGVRGGYVFALLLICLAPLALLRQVVRLGTASREQRLAALRVAGATTAEVRRLGALEVAIPALLGGSLGYVVYRGLAFLFETVADPRSGLVGPEVSRELRLVPTAVGPTWWHVTAVAIGVGLMGLVAGRHTSRALDLTPLGVSQHAQRSAPRPWGAVLLVAASVLIGTAFTAPVADVYLLASLAFLVAGLLALAPWIAYRAGRAVGARASSVSVLVAARRLTADARPAGRSAAAVGVISMTAGGGGALLPDLAATSPDGIEAMYAVPVVLAGVVLLLALVLVVFSMAVHGVETLTDRKRSTASLAAMGMSARELERVQRWEVGLVALPMAVLGVMVGTWPFLFILDTASISGLPLLVAVVTIALVWVSVIASTWVTRPWLRRAMSTANLRTA